MESRPAEQHAVEEEPLGNDVAAQQAVEPGADDSRRAWFETFLRPLDARHAHHTCSDGRACVRIVQHGDDLGQPMLATQNFGGSLGAAASLQIQDYLDGHPTPFATAIERTVEALHSRGFDVGDHRDLNPHPEGESGCGFADNRAQIIQRVATTPAFDVIVNAVLGAGTIDDHDRRCFEAVVDAYRRLHHDVCDNPSLLPRGSRLVELLEEHDGTTELLTGTHHESALIVNRRPDTTLDTDALVRAGDSAFNIDEHHVLRLQTEALGLAPEVARVINAVEWTATLLVLVADAGRPLPPVFVFD